MSEEGFSEVMGQFKSRLPEGIDISTAHAWRSRYILRTLMTE